ncbi:MAG: hypothetical protein H0X72_06720 [Acidobacteria bacterium]|nr:hypothetical protein [Acidobacteriota bacterium]
MKNKKVIALPKGENFTEKADVVATIEISNDWNDLAKQNPQKAVAEQQRVKNEFHKAFTENFVCRGFNRDEKPQYLLYVNNNNNF